MSLLDLLIVGGPPVSNAIKAEGMLAVFENSEFLFLRQYLFQADHTLIIAFILQLAVCIGVSRGGHLGLKGLGVHVLARIAILAVPLLEEITDDPVRVVVKEIVNNVVIVLGALEAILLGDGCSA